MTRKYIPFLVIPSLLATMLFSCVDLPNETTAPTWDVPLYFPLTDTTFVLEEMIEDDSSIVASDDPASLGLLYYEQENTIDPFLVDSSLSLDGFSTSASQVIGSIVINDVDPISEEILVSEWSSHSAGETVVFLESTSQLTIPFPRVDEFSYIILESGSLELTIENRLPIDIIMTEVKIKNAIGHEVVVEHPDTIFVPKENSITIPFDLGGKMIEDSLEYDGIIFSAGSGVTPVVLPVEAGTQITGIFKDLVIEEAQAVLPEQEPFSTDSVVVFDDSTKIETAIFDEGNFEITFNNYLDVEINIDLEIENLINKSGNTYTERVSLDRNELDKVISYPDLSEWKIVTLIPGTPTNELSYSAIVNTVPSTSPSTIKNTDSVSIDINFGEVTLAYVDGIVTPVSFEISETDFDFDLGDLQEKFTYDELTWGNPGIILTLNSSANMEIALDGLISGSNSSATNNMNFDVEISGGGTEVVDLRDHGFVEFMNSFSNEIPSNFSFSGNAIVNPNYVSGSVSKGDSVTGSVFVEIPLDIGIAGGSFIDTMLVDSIDMSDDDINGVNAFSITIEMTNALPIGIAISGAVLDEFGNELFPFPPLYNDNSEITVPAASVDDNGYVISSSEIIQTIELEGDDARIFLKNPNLYLDVKMDTPSQNTVKFRNTDSIRMKVYGHLNYRVNSESD